MKVSFVIQGLSTGGAERNLILIANGCAEAGDTVSILTFEKSAAIPAFPVDARVRIVALGLSTKGVHGIGKIFRLPFLIRALRRELSKLDPDAIVAFMDQANILTLLALFKRGTPCIISERVNPYRSSIFEAVPLAPLRALMRMARNALYRKAQVLVVQTERAKRVFPFWLQEKIAVIPNPILPPTLGKGEASRENLILGVGRLSAQKRFDLLIEAFAIVHKRHPEWRLEIFGEGPLREELTIQAKSLGVHDALRLPGAVREMAKVYNRASIFVLSSDYEGFPTALGEAMAHGLAVVATDCEYGPQELIPSPADGILIKCGDSKGLAQELLRLIETPELRESLGAKAQQVTTRFDGQYVLGRWSEVISAISTKRAS